MPGMRDELLRIVTEVLVPLLAADGADVYLVEATESVLRLHLGGRYSGCPGNTLAVRRFIEPAVFAVAPHASVTVTSGALVPKGAERVS